jgi:membrane protein YdbS with pleckstrin-like domain
LPTWISTVSDPDDVDNVRRLDPRRRFAGDQATHLIWICYGLTQAVLTMLLAFDVIATTTPAAVVTGVALVLYVAVNELLVRPRSRSGSSEPGS